MCDDGSDTTSVPIIVSSFSESWCGRKNCPFPYTSSACGSARSRARAGSPSSSRTSVRIASQSSPVSLTWSGVISQVSRTLRSISVCSPRPNRVGRAAAIIRLACGALTGKLIGPAPATVSWTSLAGTDSCALNAPGACEPSSTLASRSLGVIGIPVPPASRVRSVSQATQGEDGIHPNGQVLRRVRTHSTPVNQPRRAAGSGHYIPMPTQQLLDRVRELRDAGRTPKEIARVLKMPPSAVAPLIRSVAAAEGRTREDALIGCLISPGWSSSVQAPERPDWPGSAPSERTGHSGLVTVLVARDRGGSTAGVCFYLVDTWCLGLKNAAGPQSMDRRRLGGFIQQIFSAWDEPAVQVPLELGRQIVYGAIGYARELGFEPHADFGRAAGYLGAWDGECELAFGRDGKPMYISGPDDDGERIIRKLRRGLGDGNYDFVHMISG